MKQLPNLVPFLQYDLATPPQNAAFKILVNTTIQLLAATQCTPPPPGFHARGMMAGHTPSPQARYTTCGVSCSKAGWSLGSRAEPGRWLIEVLIDGKGKRDIIGFFGLQFWPLAALLYI